MVNTVICLHNVFIIFRKRKMGEQLEVDMFCEHEAFMDGLYPYSHGNLFK